MSAALLAMAIADQGMHARSLTGSQAGIITTGTHGNARIIDITPGRITKALDEDHIVIVAGFQGVAQDTKDVTTLGRGASDTTAVALAASLGADFCEIYTDVDGVFTADPRIVPSAQRIPEISYEEMLEMAACGAKILHLRCVEYARRERVPVHVRSSFSDLPGTWVRDRGPPARRLDDQEGSLVEQAIISGVAHDRSEAKITIVGVPDQIGRGGPDLRGRRRDRDQHRHDRAERVGGADLAHRHLLHAAEDRRRHGDRRAERAAGVDRLHRPALRRPDRQGLGRRRRHALAPGRDREVLLRARRRRASTSR